MNKYPLYILRYSANGYFDEIVTDHEKQCDRGRNNGRYSMSVEKLRGLFFVMTLTATSAVALTLGRILLHNVMMKKCCAVAITKRSSSVTPIQPRT